MRPGRKRATSLLEMLICCALVIIVLGLVFQLIVAGNRYLRVTEAKIDLQNDALAALTWLTREFSESDPDSFQVATEAIEGVDGVVFASPRELNGTDVSYDAVGRMLWPKYVCYYVTEINGDRCLVRKVLPNSPPTEYPPPAPPVVTVSGNGSLKYRLVAHNVEKFEVTNEEVPQITVRCKLTGTNRNYAIEIKTRIYVRN